MEKLNKCGAQYESLGDPTCDRMPAWVKNIDRHPLSAACYPISYPPCRPPVQSLSCQFVSAEAVGNSVEHFAEVQYHICSVKVCADSFQRRQCCYTFLQFFCNLSQTIARSSSLPFLRSSASFIFSVLIHMVLFSFLLRLFLFSSNKNINWISNQHCILGSSRSKNKNWGLLWHKWIHCDGATHSYFSNPLTCFRIQWLTYLVLSIHYVSDL